MEFKNLMVIKNENERENLLIFLNNNLWLFMDFNIYGENFGPEINELIKKIENGENNLYINNKLKEILIKENF